MTGSQRRVVVSQPMYFPWIGILQQMSLANVFVYYDDVQFARGFLNRVQIKTSQGPRWLTVPLAGSTRGRVISNCEIDNSQNWQRVHLDQFAQAYRNGPYFDDAISILESALTKRHSTLDELAIASTQAVVDYFASAYQSQEFLRSSSLTGIDGRSTNRLISICKRLGATHYLTGHGARNYLDHAAFELQNIKVEYVDYQLAPYPQPHGEFTPYVSSLDLIANCGRSGAFMLAGSLRPWRAFIQEAQLRAEH